MRTKRKPCDADRQFLYTDRIESPLGEIILTADSQGITELCFADQIASSGETEQDDALTNQEDEGHRIGEQGKDASERTAAAKALSQAKDWLSVYFSGREPDFSVPLHLCGTPFQEEVWELLLTIPYGQTTAYGELARRIADRHGLRRMSAQAVGGAVGRNPVPVIVPCHRVVGADGNLTGFGCGMDKKIALLKLERADMKKLWVKETVKKSI